MKRFPLWLRAELLRVRLVQGLRGKAKQNSILWLDPDERGSFHGPPNDGLSYGTRTEAELLDLVRASAAPVVWIRGREPLAHPGAGKLVRRIVDGGRTVFLETDGFYLRQRIHEFRPVSRLFLTLKFHGLERMNDLRAGRNGTFGRALEGIRAAKLSGFLICGHVLVDAATDLSELAQLKEQLLGMDADGLLASTAPGVLNTANHDRKVVEQKLREAQKMLESRGWGTLARLLDTESRSVQENPRGMRDSERTSQPAENVREEGVEVQ